MAIKDEGYPSPVTVVTPDSRSCAAEVFFLVCTAVQTRRVMLSCPLSHTERALLSFVVPKSPFPSCGALPLGVLRGVQHALYMSGDARRDAVLLKQLEQR
jgi:hypothetical protein